MAWCEANRVDYVFGLARNPRLVAEFEADLAAAAAEHAKTGKAARRFKEPVRALDSWSRERRVVGKAETRPRAPIPASWPCLAHRLRIPPVGAAAQRLVWKGVL